MSPWCSPFDGALAALSADAFVDRVIVDGLGARHVVIGHDFFFGKNRGGTPETMQAAAARAGFGITIIPPVAEDGEVFSSSAIRLRLAQGDVKGAARLLGRAWRAVGNVVGGAKRGTGLGFPTANIPLPRGTALGHGIYAVRVHTGGERHDAAAYLGTRPTYDDGMPVLEVFLFDFDGDLYGQRDRGGVRRLHPRRPQVRFQRGADCPDAGRRCPRPRHPGRRLIFGAARTAGSWISAGHVARTRA